MKNLTPSYLKHQFLIAMPHMADPNFAHTLTYIVEHNENGAMGLVINRPQELNLAVVRQLKQTRTAAELKGNAAPLVLAELRRRFPCEKPRKGKR